MLSTKPTGIHSSFESLNEKPQVSPPEEVLRDEHGLGENPQVSDSALKDRWIKSVQAAVNVNRTQAAPLLTSNLQEPAPDVCAPADVPDGHKRLINAVCASVIAELRRTVGWDIQIDEGMHIHSIDRETLRGLLQKDYRINAFQAWVLCRVQGVVYLPSQKKVLIVEEVTRSWHPELLAHEIAKGIVRLSFAIYANQQAARKNYEPVKYEDKLDQVYCAPHEYRRGVRAMACFHAAHAESIARRHRPTTHTAPIRQKLWSWLVYLTMNSFFVVRTAGVKLANDFERILAFQPDAVNLIYNHGRMTEQLRGGVGKVHIDNASRETQERLKSLGNFLHQLNPRRGAVILQMNLGSTLAFSRDE